MFYGETVTANIKTDISMMDSLVDWFGKDFRILENDGDDLLISVKCNERALFYWALQYGPYVEVVAPDELRKKLADAIDEMAKKYK